jgi:hypothetical protein
MKLSLLLSFLVLVTKASAKGFRLANVLSNALPKWQRRGVDTIAVVDTSVIELGELATSTNDATVDVSDEEVFVHTKDIFVQTKNVIANIWKMAVYVYGCIKETIVPVVVGVASWILLPLFQWLSWFAQSLFWLAKYVLELLTSSQKLRIGTFMFVFLWMTKLLFLAIIVLLRKIRRVHPRIRIFMDKVFSPKYNGEIFYYRNDQGHPYARQMEDYLAWFPAGEMAVCMFYAHYLEDFIQVSRDNIEEPRFLGDPDFVFERLPFFVGAVVRFTDNSTKRILYVCLFILCKLWIRWFNVCFDYHEFVAQAYEHDNASDYDWRPIPGYTSWLFLFDKGQWKHAFELYVHQPWNTTTVARPYTAAKNDALNTIAFWMHDKVRKKWNTLWNRVRVTKNYILDAIALSMHDKIRKHWNTLWNRVRVTKNNVLDAIALSMHDKIRKKWNTLWNNVRANKNVALNHIEDFWISVFSRLMKPSHDGWWPYYYTYKTFDSMMVAGFAGFFKPFIVAGLFLVTPGVCCLIFIYGVVLVVISILKTLWKVTIDFFEAIIALFPRRDTHADGGGVVPQRNAPTDSCDESTDDVSHSDRRWYEWWWYGGTI